MKTRDRQEELLVAMQRCLEPIASFLLEVGISFKEFQEISKVAFVKAASRPSGPRKRTANASRIAVSTGLSRKEVARINEKIQSDLLVAPQYGSPAAMVLAGWHTDERFVDEVGRPLALATDDSEGSFGHLVRTFGGDVTAGAVRTELVRAGAITQLEDQRLIPTKRHYVPSDIDAKLISSIGTMLYGLAATIAHNSKSERAGYGRIQRFVYSDFLDAASIRLFRNIARQRAAQLLENLDDWLGANQVAVSDTVESESQPRARVGVGVFYFEEEGDATSGAVTPVSGTERFQAD